jgi:hypothetical protein
MEAEDRDLLREVAQNQLRIINRLDKIIEQNVKIMASQADLDNEIQTVVSDFTANLSTSLQEVIAAIAEKSGTGTTDFSAEVASLQALDAQVTGMPAAIATALQPVVTPPATASAAPAATASAEVSRAKV